MFVPALALAIALLDCTTLFKELNKRLWTFCTPSGILFNFFRFIVGSGLSSKQWKWILFSFGFLPIVPWKAFSKNSVL